MASALDLLTAQQGLDVIEPIERLIRSRDHRTLEMRQAGRRPLRVHEQDAE
jgi:hypothetical protein